MKIVLDAMGSDLGATPLVEGAVQAVKMFDCEILLVGKQHTLRRLLRYFRYNGHRIRIVPCSQTVRMDDSPSESLQKKDSSIAVATRLVRDGEGDALVSAGNTGATLAHAMTQWRRIKGVSRPGIASLMPTPKHPCLFLDVGANVDCKPRNLLDFAVMGSVYSREILGQSSPRVGILNVGSEASKGNTLTRATYQLLENSHLNFIGNVEGRSLFSGDVDVVVCDGFVGNIALKVTEAAAMNIMAGVKGALTQNVFSLAAAIMVSPGMRRWSKRLDYTEYGGAPLLGLNGNCIISHGSSSARAIRNAVRVAIDTVNHRLIERISRDVEKSAREVEQIEKV